jgi:serine/threonine protein kinase/Tol biopolymer transport system component
MAFAAGTRLGPYEILGALGAGGMGEVYKARDTRLDRPVALKVIQPAASASAEMRERFEREARAISALDHPNICILYDVAKEGDLSFLVMQYLEGETLSDRLARAGKPSSAPTQAPSSPEGEVSLATISRGPIPFDTALTYAIEIARALDAAHRRGIVHRDLKPGNVMLTKTGTKLLDFGLAKLAAGDDTGVAGFGDDVTRTTPLTSRGTLLGTLHYMSPEQLEGREVDARSDIHAFGALLFEMLAGRRAFEGQSQAGTITAIVGNDPPILTSLADLRVSLAPAPRRALDRLLAKCLAKDPEDRWQSAADLASELKWIKEERQRVEPEAASAPSAPPVDVSARTRERIVIALAVALGFALAAVTYLWYPRPGPPAPVVTFTIDAPEGKTLPSGPGLLALSPDGTKVAFTTGQGDNSQLWIRPVGSLSATLVDRVTGAWHPAWSPDGGSIAFTENRADGGLRRIDLAAGAPIELAPAASGRVAWGRGGVILFGHENRLYRVAESGGPASLAMDLDASRHENSIDWPMFLPDGRRYLFVTRGRDAAKTGVFLASLDSPERTFLVNVLSSVDYSNGHLFYHRDGTLMAQPFDVDQGRLTGDAFPVIEDVRHNAGNGRAAFSVSESGSLVYVQGAALNALTDNRLIVLDGSGNVVQELEQKGSFIDAALAPHGRRAVVTREVGQSGVRSLWLLDLDRGVLAKFTTGDATERTPVWSPDGSFIAFGSQRSQTYGLYRRSSGGAATSDELLFSSTEPMSPTSFSPDGQSLLFSRGIGQEQRIWLLPLTGDRKPVEVFPGAAIAHYNGAFSPDGKWIAYTAQASTSDVQTFIQPYPPDGRREQVSTAGGLFPRWIDGGRRIVYRALSNDFVSVELTNVGGMLRASVPTVLFKKPRASSGNWYYSVNGQADRFLLVQPSEKAVDPVPPPITVVVNFVQSLAGRKK